MLTEDMIDKKFKAPEEGFIVWHCKRCNAENRELVKDTFTIANITLTNCRCGKINLLDIKTLKHIN